MFTDGKTHCCSDVNSLQIDLWIQNDFNQNIGRHFVETEELILRLLWKKQKNSQNNFEKRTKLKVLHLISRFVINFIIIIHQDSVELS